MKAEDRYPITLSLGTLAPFGFESVGKLEVLSCCRFDLWQRDSETAISIENQCAGCIRKLRELIGRATPDRLPLHGEGGWLLVVIPDGAILEPLSGLLTAEGFRVVVTTTNRDALRVLQDGDAGLPCLILDALSAADLAKLLEDDERLARIPRCVIGGTPGDPPSPGNHTLPHPLDLDALIAIVERYCDRSADAAGERSLAS